MKSQRDIVGDNEGVSVVVGTVLLLGIAVTFIALVQLNYVPVWNEEIEYKHNQEVGSSMRDVRDAVVSTASAGSVRSVSLNLGTDYPNRLILRNPPPSTGTLSTTPPVNVSVANVTVTGDAGDYWRGGVKNFSTRGITYVPDYNEFTNAPTTVYENSVLYNRQNESNVSLTDQSLVNGRRINLFTLNGSYSQSGSSTVSVTTQPVSAPANAVAVTDDAGSGGITVEVPTLLDNSTWSQLLRDEYVSNGGFVVNQSYVASPSGRYSTLRLEFEAGVTYEMRMAKVGVGSSVAPEGARYLVSTRGDGSSVPEGGSQTLEVEVRDRFNNPVSGATVNLSLNGDGGLNTDANTYVENATTGPDGRVSVEYVAPDDVTGVTQRTYEVNASVVNTSNLASFDADAEENVTFEVQVQNSDGSGLGAGGGGGGGGAYDVLWKDPSGQTGTSDCSATDCTLNASKSTTLDLTMDTVPTAEGASVWYSVNNTAVGTVSPSTGTTNSAGENTTTLEAQANGTVKVYTSSGGSGDGINVTVKNFPSGIFYNDDATAVDIDNDSTKSGVKFSITNNFDSQATINEIEVSATAGDRLEESGGPSPWDAEVNIEAANDGDYDDNQLKYNTRVVLDNFADISGNGGTADIYLSKFQQGGNNEINIEGETVTVTLYFQNKNSKMISFTP
ncbi:MAG: hypothetical protein SV760_03715 [Halobacteria archaeon]|nr:hypothetical protein [Halobacteria archaeon]